MSNKIGSSVLKKRSPPPPWITPKIEYSIIVNPADLTVKTPYNKDYLDEFKEKIPENDRKWDPERKWWVVKRKHLKEIKYLANKYFMNLEEAKKLLSRYRKKCYGHVTVYEIPEGLVSGDIENIIDKMAMTVPNEKWHVSFPLAANWRAQIYIPDEGFYFFTGRGFKSRFYSDYSLIHKFTTPQIVEYPRIIVLPKKFKGLRWTDLFREFIRCPV